MLVGLPDRRQLPAAHKVHDEAPARLKVPAGQELAVPGAPVPAGQYMPAEHEVPKDVAPSAQNVPATHGKDVAAVLAVAVQ